MIKDAVQNSLGGTEKGGRAGIPVGRIRKGIDNLSKKFDNWLLGPKRVTEPYTREQWDQALWEARNSSGNLFWNREEPVKTDKFMAGVGAGINAIFDALGGLSQKAWEFAKTPEGKAIALLVVAGASALAAINVDHAQAQGQVHGRTDTGSGLRWDNSGDWGPQLNIHPGLTRQDSFIVGDEVAPPRIAGIEIGNPESVDFWSSTSGMFIMEQNNPGGYSLGLGNAGNGEVIGLGGDNVLADLTGQGVPAKEIIDASGKVVGKAVLTEGITREKLELLVRNHSQRKNLGPQRTIETLFSQGNETISIITRVMDRVGGDGKPKKIVTIFGVGADGQPKRITERVLNQGQFFTVSGSGDGVSENVNLILTNTDFGQQLMVFPAYDEAMLANLGIDSSKFTVWQDQDGTWYSGTSAGDKQLKLENNQWVEPLPDQFTELQARLGDDYKLIEAQDETGKFYQIEGVEGMKIYEDGTSEQTMQFEGQDVNLTIDTRAISVGSNGELVWGIWHLREGQWLAESDAAPATSEATNGFHNLVVIKGHPKYEQMLDTVHIAVQLALAKTETYDPAATFEHITVDDPYNGIMENVDVVPSKWKSLYFPEEGGINYSSESLEHGDRFDARNTLARPLMVVLKTGFFNLKVLDNNGKLEQDALVVPIVAMNPDRSLQAMAGLISRSALDEPNDAGIPWIGYFTEENKGFLLPVLRVGEAVKIDSRMTSDQKLRSFMAEHNKWFFDSYEDEKNIQVLPQGFSWVFFEFIRTENWSD